MEFNHANGSSHTRLKKLHWRSALLTVFRLRKTESLVDDEIPAELRITTTLSPELTSQLDLYVSAEDFVEVWNWDDDWVAEKNLVS